VRAGAPRPGLGKALAVPLLIWGAAMAWAVATGQPALPRALAYAAYLFAPALLVLLAPGGDGTRDASGEPPPLVVLAAAVMLWLPVEFDLLPPLRVPAPRGPDVSRLLGLLDALWLFLTARPLRGAGLSPPRARDVGLAVAAFAVYAVVALPVGLATGFIVWNPRLAFPRALATPLLIYLVTAFPEEFLFRGLIQNALGRLLRPGVALGVASVVFGLAHLPDPRYVLLATVAGVAYGWVYARTGRVTAAAVTHALVDAAWVLLLRR
jgi:uncharacterized protein